MRGVDGQAGRGSARHGEAWLGMATQAWRVTTNNETRGAIMAEKPATMTEIEILKVNTGRIAVCLIGDSPIILNRLSEKVMRELLMPKGRKTAADKAGSLKHEPMPEFSASPYTDRDPNGPTFIQHLSSAFKKALMTAAIDIPGAAKAQVGRLSWVIGDRVPIYGVPQILLSPVRSADMNHTPDIRSRAIIRHWACTFEIAFVTPLLKQASIANLLASAGLTQGVGDWRPQKGAGSYGQFSLCNADDPRYLTILAEGGRAAQLAAMKNPVAFDQETEDLLRWFAEEKEKRGWNGATKTEKPVKEFRAAGRG
jgi:hypothetical protein